MKQILCLLLFVAVSSLLTAQAPQAINYQAIARNNANTPIPNQAVGVRFSILQGGTANRSATYVETHQTTTNALGLFNLHIGRGTPLSGTFAGIDWGHPPCFLEVAIDPAGGGDYQVVGTSELVSVPYALKAGVVEQERQVLTVSGKQLSISEGNTVTLSQAASDVLEDGSDVASPNDTRVRVYDPLLPPLHLDEIHMDLGKDRDLVAKPDVLVLRKNGKIAGLGVNPNPNVMLEIFDPSGGDNLFVGRIAGEYNQYIGGAAPEGDLNTAFGSGAFQFNTKGRRNTAIGHSALNHNIGSDNTAVGQSALLYNTDGNENTAVGVGALYSPLKNSRNTAVGYYAMFRAENNTGSNPNGRPTYNTGVGYMALIGGNNISNNTGRWNTALGSESLSANTTGDKNTATGVDALLSNTTGSNNTAIGSGADVNVTNGQLNNATAIGANAKVTTSDAMILGDPAVKVGIGLSGNPVGPGNKLEINTGLSGASGLRLRQLNSFFLPLPPPNPSTTPEVLTVNAAGDVELVELTGVGGGNNNWELNGNVFTGVVPTPFLGTTDPLTPTTLAPLYFKVNNQPSGTIHPNGPTFLGFEAGLANNNATAPSNTAIGYRALRSNTTGMQNTAVGDSSLWRNATGVQNTANGALALKRNINGSRNTASGYKALTLNTASDNTAHGANALATNTGSAVNGFRNTATGSSALNMNATGSRNTANGAFALQRNTANDNTATGSSALESNTTGSFNTAMGVTALFSNKANSRSTAIGHRAMYYADNRTAGRETFNTAVGYQALQGSIVAANNTGQYNTAVGDRALGANTTGYGNSATGTSALEMNTIGFQNTAAGWGALTANVSGIRNTATGASALKKNTATDNTANGAAALEENTTGTENTATGAFSLNANNTGAYNTANGSSALRANTAGNANTAIGTNALFSNKNGSSNTSVGMQSLYRNDGTENTSVGVASLNFNGLGNANTAVGKDALLINDVGSWNAAVGKSALSGNTTGDNNTAMGMVSLQYNKTGSCNTAVGYKAGPGVVNGAGLPNLSNTLALGCDATVMASDATAIGYGAKALTRDEIRLGNAALVNVLPGNTCLASLGNTTWRWKEVWACNGVFTGSDSRLKSSIANTQHGLSEVMRLRPVQYEWKASPEHNLTLGFIAQEVECIVPEAVVVPKNKDEFYSMNYDALIPVLTKAIQEQQAQIETLKTQNAQLGALTQQNQSLQTQLNEMRAEMKSFRAALAQQTAANKSGDKK